MHFDECWRIFCGFLVLSIWTWASSDLFVDLSSEFCFISSIIWLFEIHSYPRILDVTGKKNQLPVSSDTENGFSYQHDSIVLQVNRIMKFKSSEWFCFKVLYFLPYFSKETIIYAFMQNSNSAPKLFMRMFKMIF